MAISNSWTFELPAPQLATGAVVPTISRLTTPNKETFTLNLDGATYDNAVSITGLAAIGAATMAAIDTDFASDVFGLDAALTITMRTYITNIERRFDNFEPGDYRNQYKAATNIFKVTGYVEWVIVP